MVDLKERSTEPEQIDDPSVRFEDFQETISQLELINHLTLLYVPILWAVETFWKRKSRESSAPLRILDLGCGHGDVLRKIYQWGSIRGIPLELTGVDISPWSKKAAEMATPESYPIRYMTRNIFALKKAEKYDVLINTQFMHHLAETNIVELVQWMTAHCHYGWLILDLHRHIIPYFISKYLFRLISRNSILLHDSPTSVARSFVRADWQQILEKAGLPDKDVTIAWLLFRYAVRYLRP